MKKERKVSKTGYYLPDNLIAAMRVIKDKEFINQSHQVEMALRMYLVKYEKLLKAEGVSI